MVDNSSQFFTYTTINSSSIVEEQDPENAVVFCGVMLVCLIIGLAGHIWTLLSVVYYEELQRPLNVLIVNLCISQFFHLMVTVFGDIIIMLSRSNYTTIIDNSDVLCFLALLFATSTSIFYGFIFLNRLISTMFEALYSRWSWTSAWVLVVVGWVLSSVGSAFPWMTKSVTFHHDGYFILGYPWFSSSANSSNLYWFLMTMYFFLPTLAVITIASVVLVYSWRIQRSTGVALNTPRAVTLRDRFRVMLMLVVCASIHIVFYYATYIYWKSGRHMRPANYFFLWLIYVQNALNPFIFGAIQPQFREAYIRVWYWILRKWSCRNNYGDSRRVFPTMAASIENIRPQSAVTFQSGKNSVIIHHTPAAAALTNNGANVDRTKNASQRAETSRNNRNELRVQEISASKTSDG